MRGRKGRCVGSFVDIKWKVKWVCGGDPMLIDIDPPLVINNAPPCACSRHRIRKWAAAARVNGPPPLMVVMLLF